MKKLRFLSVFRVRDGDRDGFCKHLRLARCLFLAMICLTMGPCMALPVAAAFATDSFSITLLGPVIALIVILQCGSSKDERMLSRPVRSPWLASLMMALGLVAGEVAPTDWWNQPAMLERWRWGVAVMVAAWLLLWATEKGVERRRSRSAGYGAA